MKKTIPAAANIIGLVVTAAVSYLSVTGIFNHNTMSLQSARHPSLFTPAPWAFSIWGLIYLALAGFVVFQARKNDEAFQLRSRVGGWFLLSCLANSCWVIAWMYDLAGVSVLLMMVLLFSLFMIVLRTDMELTDPPLRTIAFVWWPFCLYSGWITVALLANVAAVIGAGASAAIVMSLVAGAVFLTMTWRRNMREYALVGAYALVAVGVADWHRATEVSWTSFVVAGILFVSSSWHAWKNRAYSPFRRRN
jgi:hypothetical protein